MIGLLLKLVACPIIIVLSYLFFDEVNFSTIYQPILIGVLLAVLAHVMELLILKRETFSLSTVLDFIVSFGIVYLSQFFLLGVKITLTGALLTASLLGITEYFQHRYLIRTSRVVK